MANVSIKIPALNQSYYDAVSSKANQDKINNIIKPKYGAIVDNISAITNVPKEIIYAFIFIESGGNEKAKSPYATGLMQLNGATASDLIVKEKGAGRLSEAESNMLKKYLGSRYSLVESVKPKQTSLGKTFITNDDLLKPEFNILLGSLLIGQLISEFTESDGKIRMDKVVTIYNGGRYGATAKKVIPFQGSTEQLIAIVPKETSAYILKLLGTQGVLDTMV